MDYRSGQNCCIFKASTITSNGTWSVISTSTVSANAANITGWMDFAFYWGLNGQMSLWINGAEVATATDTTYFPNGQMYYGYEVSTGRIGPGLLNSSGSTFLKNQGSLAGFSSYTFSYNSTTTSITWQWGAFTVYAPDGSTISVSSGTQTGFTGLTSNTTYKFGMYYDLISQTPVVVMSDVSGGTGNESNSQVFAVVNGDNHVPINVNISAATPASGTGSGSGTGGGIGGGGTCFSPNTKVRTDRGDVAFRDVRIGDKVLTARGTWKPVIGISANEWNNPVLDMGGDEFSTPRHSVLHENVWKEMHELNRFDWVEYSGIVLNLHIECDSDDDGTQPDTEHSYTLANGLVVHNGIIVPC